MHTIDSPFQNSSIFWVESIWSPVTPVESIWPLVGTVKYWLGVKDITSYLIKMRGESSAERGKQWSEGSC